MAKSRDGSKSHAISEYLASNKEASPKQIVEGLKEKGIEVSFGLASAVKYETKAKKKGSKKKSKRTVAVKAKTEPGVSMSDAIRQFIVKNPKAGPKDIQAGLKAEGTNVKLGLISAVKYSKAKKKSAKRARKTARRATVHVAARQTPATAMSFEQLIEVKRFADSIGGADQIRQALEMLEQLR